MPGSIAGPAPPLPPPPPQRVYPASLPGPGPAARAPQQTQVVNAGLRLDQIQHARTSTLNAVADSRSDIELNVAGELEKIPFAYGRTRVGAKIATICLDGNDLVILAVWCHGGQTGIQEIEDVQVDGNTWDEFVTATGTLQPPNAANYGTVSRTDYLGTTTQTADPTLAGCIAGYADTLVTTIPQYSVSCGIAYSVIVLPGHASVEHLPEFVATIKGLKVYDPRASGQLENDASTWTYSTTPALCAANFESSYIYGRGRAVDWTSVATVADENDELVAGNPRRTIGLSINSQTTTRNMAEALRTYAEAFIVDEAGLSKFIADRPASVSRSLDMSDIVADSMELSKRDLSNTPTVVRVRYTDTTAEPWRDAFATAKAPNVDAGLVPRRENNVDLPGLVSHEDAYRTGIQRLNRGYLTDLDITFISQDESLEDLVGDVIDFTHDVGLTAKTFRITGVSAVSTGRWRVSASEYSASAYSDVVVVESSSDTDLPDPRDIGAVQNLAISEKTYQDETGTYYSRLEIQWDRIDSSYVLHYLVRISSDNEINRHNVSNGLDTVIKTVSGNVTQGVLYEVHVCAATSVGFGPEATASVTATGRNTSPSPPTNLSAEQIGEFVYLSWDETQEPDISGYPVRRGTTSQTIADWASMTIVAEKADVTYVMEPGVAIGTHRYFVRSVDSRYSADATPALALSQTAAVVDLEVGAGDSVSSFESRSGTISTANEMASQVRSGVTWWETDTAQAWTDRWTVANSWASQTPASPWAVPTGTKTDPYVETGVIDFAQDVSGVWTRQITTQAIGTGGTHDVSMFLATAANYALSPPEWTEYMAASAKANARYVKLKISDTGPTTSALSVRDDVIVSVATEADRESNLLINGDFISWQEGTSIVPSASVVYAADTFYVTRGSDNGNVTISRQTGRTGGRSTYALRAQRDSGTTNVDDYDVSVALEEEEVAALWGSVVTVDLWMQTGANFETSGDYPYIEKICSPIAEANWDTLDGHAGKTTETLKTDATDLPLISDGTNSWVRLTAAFPTAIPTGTKGFAVRVVNVPSAGTAGANDWFDIGEWQVLRGNYTAANVPDFTTDSFPLTFAKIFRYLRYSQSTGQASEFAHQMRVTPSETGGGAPYKYDARL